MAAPMCELFSLCRDAAAVASRVEVRFISSLKDVGIAGSASIYCPSLTVHEEVMVSHPLELLRSMWRRYIESAVREGIPGFLLNAMKDDFIERLEGPDGSLFLYFQVKMGKGLFASKDIRKGETIFVEQPIVSAQFLWNALYKYEACDYCMRSLETAEENSRRLSGNPNLILPHPELCSVRKELLDFCPACQELYCSVECRQAALKQHHQILCLGPSKDDPQHPLNKLQEGWRKILQNHRIHTEQKGAIQRIESAPTTIPPRPRAFTLATPPDTIYRMNMHYPPETASIMLMARMVAMVKQAKDKGRWMKLFSQFCSRTANEEEEIVHKLIGDKFQGQLETLRQLFTKALYEESLNQWFTPEGFRSLFTLVGTNGQGIGTSSLSQWVHACDALQLPAQAREELDGFIDQLYKDIEKESGEFLNCEGSGLYTLQSCCNHSCDPNAETSFPENNFLLHLTALRDIKAGEEVCITYLDCCQRDRSRHTRHKILRENYLFICSCPKCVAQADDPDLTSEEEEEIEADAESAELEDEMTDV